MQKLTFELLIDYLGQPNKHNYGYSMWQCPICNDKGKNNLVYTHKTNTIWCYADDLHAPAILKDIYNKNKENYKTNTFKPVQKPKLQKIELPPEKQQQFTSYLYKCEQELLQDEHFLALLLKNRGISKSTVEYCHIGIDKQKARWVFPTYKYCCDTVPKLIGFEYRPLNLSKNGLYREKGTPTGMAMINTYNNKTCVLVIIEGYLDGYAFADHLGNLNQLQFYHITTPSNGVSGITKLLDEIEYCFDKYKKVYAYLDSDEVSLPKMELIQSKYPFIEIVIMQCGCKDFNEHYLKCIKKL